MGFVRPGWAILFGVIPTIIIYVLLVYKHHLRVDDTLDVAIIHGIGMSLHLSSHPLLISFVLSGGIIGAFMTGLFTDLGSNSGGADGAFYGRPVQLWYQIAGILTAIGKIEGRIACSISLFSTRFW